MDSNNNGHLAPSYVHNDPFATPTRLSATGDRTPPQGGWGQTQPPLEMQDHRAQPAALLGAPAGRPTFLQKWKAADERLWLATAGKVGSAGGRGGSEKQLGARPRRRRRPAFLCTMILGLLLLVLVAIIVPIAVVFGTKKSSDSSSSSSSDGDMGAGSSNPGTTPQVQNSGIVTVQNGQYQGTNLANGITSYLGLPYAAPPMGDLRFAAPQPPVNFSGTTAATKVKPGCHGLGSFNSAQNEDCLYLDLYTPTNVTKDSKLPVLVFIQGGGLQNAASHYNGSSLIAASGMQMITVSFTYRVNAFGFLASKEIQSDGSLNIGLKDQREALKWVQKNIQQFGGDPNHVVIGGNSGGAGSCVLQLTAYGGRNDKLFHGVIMQSQSVQAVRDVANSQYQYDYIVGNTSCKGKPSSDTLSCLRGISIQSLVAAIQNSPFPNGAGGNPVYPYNPVLDKDFVQSLPVEGFATGQFVDVPMIFGDVTDEGTIFVPQKSIETKSDSNDFLRNTFPKINNTVLEKYSSLYNFSDTSADDYWRYVSTAYGETRYTCPGVQLSNYAAKNNSGKVWNYRYDVKDPKAEDAGLGVRHGSEMPAVWAGNSVPDSYRINQKNANAIPLVQAYWTSFIKHLDPNTEKLGDAPTWEAWKNNNRLHITADDPGMEDIEDAQAKRCAFLNSISTQIGQ